MATERIRSLKPAKFSAELTQHIGKVLAGKEPDKYGIAEAFHGAVIASLYKSIAKAFLAKKKHGRDELGLRWKDHSPKTKAYKKARAPRVRRGFALPGPRGRPTLSPPQNRLWKKKFVQKYKQLSRVVSEEDAKRIAAGHAWNFVKARGAKTLLQLTKSSKFDLNYETGVLQRSLLPAFHRSPSPYIATNENQIAETKTGDIVIGTTVEYADEVHKLRPLWPDPFPAKWLARAVQEGNRAIVLRMREVL